MYTVLIVAFVAWKIVQAVRKSQQEAQKKLIVPSQAMVAEPSPLSQEAIEQYNRSQSERSLEVEESHRREIIETSEVSTLDRPKRSAKKRGKTPQGKRASGRTLSLDEISENELRRVSLLGLSDEQSQSAYQTQKSAVRRKISLDKESLRVFFVTRELLGAPRARAKYRPGVRR